MPRTIYKSTMQQNFTSANKFDDKQKQDENKNLMHNIAKLINI